LFNTDYFISVYYNVLLYSYFEGTPDASPRFGIGKAMLIVYRFYHIQHRRSGAKIVAASGHQEVKNCTQTYLRRGSAPDPAGRAYIALPVALVGGEGARSLRVSALRLPSPGKNSGQQRPSNTVERESNVVDSQVNRVNTTLFYFLYCCIF